MLRTDEERLQTDYAWTRGFVLQRFILPRSGDSVRAGWRRWCGDSWVRGEPVRCEERTVRVADGWALRNRRRRRGTERSPSYTPPTPGDGPGLIGRHFPEGAIW